MQGTTPGLCVLFVSCVVSLWPSGVQLICRGVCCADWCQCTTLCGCSRLQSLTSAVCASSSRDHALTFEHQCLWGLCKHASSGVMQGRPYAEPSLTSAPYGLQGQATP